MWTKVSAEEARQHPLFGVKGSLLLVRCFMILLVLLLLANFCPSVPLVMFILATWGLFRRKAYVRFHVYGVTVLTIVGLIFVFYVSDVPPGGAVVMLLINVPLCPYFT